MELIIKHTAKSMMAHKMRTFLLLFTVSIASLAAMLCFDMSGSLQKNLEAQSKESTGKADIIVSAAFELDETVTKGLPACDMLLIATGSQMFTRRIEGTYDMLTQKSCHISGVEPDKAHQMGILKEEIELEEGCAVVSEGFAKEFGYEKGDPITLYNEQKQPMDFTVSTVYSGKDGLFSQGDTIVVSLSSMKKLYDRENLGGKLAYLDLADDSRVTEAVKTIEERFPAAKVQTLVNNEQTQAFLENITRIFTVLFVVCLLLVVFVTVSASQRIITEKMPVIGTFRSLGISSRLTYTVLLGENIAYGLIGSLIGIGGYAILRPMIYRSGAIGATNAGHMSGFVASGVIMFCVLLECLCPIKEILKAMKVSIRDIIFQNKDTQYKQGKAATAVGIVLILITGITAFFSKSFFAGLICFVSAAIGAALLFPFILRGITGLLSMAFDRKNKPVAKLAAVEAREKKSTVGSAVLCFTAAAVCIVVYQFAASLSAFYSHENYTGDLIVMSDGNTDRSRFSYIEDIDGVELVEYGYFKTEILKINGQETTSEVPIYGWKEGGYQLYTGVTNVPGDLQEEEMVVGKGFARRYGLKKGDTVSVVFRSGGFMPVEKTLTVRDTGLIDYENSIGVTVVITEKLFKEIYKEMPANLIVKCSDPEAVKTVIKNHSADTVSSIETHEEYRERVHQDSASMMVIIDGVILLALGITFIGVVSNCLIGFEGRKRECAVLMSTALTREKLSWMFLGESAFASLSAIAAAIPLAVFMYLVFMNILDGLLLTIPVRINIGACVVLGILIWGMFTLSALFPVKALKKMNIAAQLKYE